jgi:serine/threonine protein kinase
MSTTPPVPPVDPVAPTSAQEFLEALKGAVSLSAEDLARATQAASSAGDPRALGQALVGLGILTDYQADTITQGKHRELRLGNYLVIGRLGAGGMGTVYKARHRRMNRLVALKVLLGNLGQDATFVQRFQREVETIARLNHPHIVMAFDADVDEGRHFLVMEFVEGQDLASLVAAQGPLPFASAVDAVLHAARGLAYAHSQGIIHRDIKPANLLRDAAGVVKVTDLGLARLNNPPNDPNAPTVGGSITQVGGIVGTIDYMPPEQAMDATSIDHRADVYSLGATLHFLLLGRPPYQGSTLMATLLKHRDAPVPSLVEALPGVPVALDAVFRKMLAKNPADRYQAMADVVSDLERINVGPIDQTLVLPASGLKPSPPPSLESLIALPAEAPPPGPSILLVEPSRTQAAIIRRYLKERGIENLAAATSGRDALETVRRERPGVVVSAMHLPDMTGVDLARQLRAEIAGEGAPGFVLISSEDEQSEAGNLTGYGSAVLLHKPFQPEELAEAIRMVTPAPSGLGSFRVLIADDSSAARAHIKSVLRGFGMNRFLEASDGAQAVAAAARESFDLVVTDYNMPFMDGHSLVAYLKQNPSTASVPIIMVTTEDDPAKLEAVRQLGVTAVCDKRFRPEDVGAVLKTLARTP